MGLQPPFPSSIFRTFSILSVETFCGGGVRHGNGKETRSRGLGVWLHEEKLLRMSSVHEKKRNS